MKRTNTVRLMREEQQLMKDPIEFAVVRRKDILAFHFCLFGLDGDYKGGFYHGVLNLPEQYPFSPPELKFFTPSGYFQQGKPVCTTFTNYHKETWSAVWNVESMVLATISFMLAGDPSVGVKIEPAQLKRKYASNSMTFNIGNPQFMEIFGKEPFVLKYLEANKKQEREANQGPEVVLQKAQNLKELDNVNVPKEIEVEGMQKEALVQVEILANTPT